MTANTVVPDFTGLADGDKVTLRFAPIAGDGIALDRPHVFLMHTPHTVVMALASLTNRLAYFFWDPNRECWTTDQGATRVSVVG
jgi:hypothetical protein